MLKHTNSLQKSQCPVVICPCLCSSDVRGVQVHVEQPRLEHVALAAGVAGEEEGRVGVDAVRGPVGRLLPEQPLGGTTCLTLLV